MLTSSWHVDSTVPSCAAPFQGKIGPSKKSPTSGSESPQSCVFLPIYMANRCSDCPSTIPKFGNSLSRLACTPKLPVADSSEWCVCILPLMFEGARIVLFAYLGSWPHLVAFFGWEKSKKSPHDHKRSSPRPLLQVYAVAKFPDLAFRLGFRPTLCES
jgi:hypothetical protein